MKIDFKDPASDPSTPLRYPVLLEGKDGCVKLFTNVTDGILLRGANDTAMVRLDVVLSGATPATNREYWRPYVGQVVLQNS